MSLFKGVQVALFLSTTTFSLLSLPLITFGDKPVEVEVDHQTQFIGSLRDVSAPYLGGVALLSLSLGTAALGLSGWRSSHRHRKTLTQSLASLETKLAKRDAQIQSLKLSDRRLQSSELGQFLLDAAPVETAKVTATPVTATPVTATKVTATTAITKAVTKPATVIPAKTTSTPRPQTSVRTMQAVLHRATAQSPTVLKAVPRQVQQQPRSMSTAHAFSVQASYSSQPAAYNRAQSKPMRAKQSVTQPVSL